MSQVVSKRYTTTDVSSTREKLAEKRSKCTFARACRGDPWKCVSHSFLLGLRYVPSVYTISFIPHYKPRTHLEQNKSKQGTHLHITLFTNSKHERTTKLEEMHKSKLLKRLYALLHMQVMKSDFRHPKLTCLPVCYK